MDTSMTKTIVKSAVAVVCTAALCITYATSNSKKAAPEKTVTSDTAVFETVEPETSYISEAQAAAYIGISETALKTIREKTPQFIKGSYMTYTYYNDEGTEITTVVYNKAALDKVIDKLMNSDNKYINLRYIQETTKAAK